MTIGATVSIDLFPTDSSCTIVHTRLSTHQAGTIPRGLGKILIGSSETAGGVRRGIQRSMSGSLPAFPNTGEQN